MAITVITLELNEICPVALRSRTMMGATPFPLGFKRRESTAETAPDMAQIVSIIYSTQRNTSGRNSGRYRGSEKELRGR